MARNVSKIVEWGNTSANIVTPVDKSRLLCNDAVRDAINLQIHVELFSVLIPFANWYFANLFEVFENIFC